MDEFNPELEGATLASGGFDPEAEGGVLVNNTSSSPISNQNPKENGLQSTFHSIISNIGKYAPSPSIPLGVNIGSGLLGSLFPGEQRNAISHLPQIATGSNFGVPQVIASGIGSTIPALMSGGESLLGQAGAGGVMGALQAPPGERLKGGLENALSTLALGKILPHIASVLTPVSPVQTAKSIQAGHDALSQQAAEGFKNVSEAVADRGIKEVPIDDSFVKGLKEYFPKTRTSAELLDKASNGDYDSLRKIQSDLWSRGTKNKGSDLESERLRGDEMFEARDDINDAISSHLKDTGNEDLDNLLNESRKNYYDLRNTYYDHPTIARMVEPGNRKIPTNVMNVLQENSERMEKVRQAHPEVVSAINAFNNKKSSMNFLKGIGVGGAAAGAAYHYLKPGNNPLNHTP